MESIYIGSVGFALGDLRFDVDELEDQGRLFSTASQLRESGFNLHHRCSDDQSPLDLAVDALQYIVGGDSFSAQLEDADAIFYATCLTCNGNIGSVDLFSRTGDVKSLMDFPVSHLQSKFNMENAFALGLNQTACTSLLGSIRMARNTLVAEPDLQKIVCVTADRFPPGAKYEQSFNVISDAAAACIVQRKSGPFKIIGSHQITNGAMAQASDDETAGFYFNYSVRSIREALERFSLGLDEVQWIVPQNTNIKAWKVLSSFLRFPFDRVVAPTLQDVGHCISGDNLINLLTAYRKGIFSPGDKLLLPMAGFGLNWACLLLEVTG